MSLKCRIDKRADDTVPAFKGCSNECISVTSRVPGMVDSFRITTLLLRLIRNGALLYTVESQIHDGIFCFSIIAGLFFDGVDSTLSKLERHCVCDSLYHFQCRLSQEFNLNSCLAYCWMYEPQFEPALRLLRGARISCTTRCLDGLGCKQRRKCPLSGVYESLAGVISETSKSFVTSLVRKESAAVLMIKSHLDFESLVRIGQALLSANVRHARQCRRTMSPTALSFLEVMTIETTKIRQPTREDQWVRSILAHDKTACLDQLPYQLVKRRMPFCRRDAEAFLVSFFSAAEKSIPSDDIFCVTRELNGRSVTYHLTSSSLLLCYFSNGNIGPSLPA